MLERDWTKPTVTKRKSEREVGNEAKEVVRQAGNIEPCSS